MWIFTKYGFFSVVLARKDATSREVDNETFMIRSRNKTHLENIIAAFEELNNLNILETADSDYKYRIFVKKTSWSDVMNKITKEIDYDNFKNKVFQTTKDYDFCHSLSDVWSIMYDYQNRNK